jgi:hypothetical protein
VPDAGESERFAGLQSKMNRHFYLLTAFHSQNPSAEIMRAPLAVSVAYH